MRRFLSIGLLLLLPALAAAAVDLPNPPPRHFHDEVGVVSADEARALDAELAAFEQRTGYQFVIAALKDLDGDLEDYVNRLFEHWGIGSRGKNDGVLLAVFPDQRKSRLEVGYELEEALPDVIANRILDEMVQIPASHGAGRFYAVMTRVAQRIAPDDPLAAGRSGVSRSDAPRERSRGRGLGNIFWLIILIAVAGGGRSGRSRWLGPLLIMSAMSGGSGGRRGGGFGGGGFGGGGGFSGGGGASGGW